MWGGGGGADHQVHSKKLCSETEFSFILFQPDYSFSLTHNIGVDHPPMPDDLPSSEWSPREKVRRRFAAADRKYYVPPLPSYPQATLYVPHHDPQLACDGFHWQWWNDEPGVAQTVVQTQHGLQTPTTATNKSKPAEK